MIRTDQEGAPPGPGGGGLSPEKKAPKGGGGNRVRRRAKRFTKTFLGFLLVLLAGGILRGLSFTHYPGRAEAALITESLHMEKNRSLTPPVTRSGPLAHYFYMALAAGGRALDLFPGPAENLAQWSAAPPGAPTRALRMARLTALILGLLALAGTFLAGFQCGGVPGALTAGFALAFSPLAVQQGRLLSPSLASMAMIALGVGFAAWGVRIRRTLPALLAALFFGLSFGGRPYGIVLFLPLFLIHLDITPKPKSRFRRGFFLVLALLAGVALSSAGRLGDFSWWREYLATHLVGPPKPAFGLEGEPTGWAFHLTYTLKEALGFPLFTLTGVVGLFFGMRSGRFEWRFLFWSFCLYFVLVGGVQDRRTSSLLPLAVILAAGAGLFVASFWYKLAGHPGAAVLTLLVALMLAVPVPGLFQEARILGNPDTRVLARRFLEMEAPPGPKSFPTATILPLREAAPCPAGCPRTCRDAYPELMAPVFRNTPLSKVRYRPVMNHELWPTLEFIRNGGPSPWRVYIWSGWADGLLETRGGGTYQSLLAASRILEKHAVRVVEFGKGPLQARPLAAGAADRVVCRPDAPNPGPWIRIFFLKTPAAGSAPSTEKAGIGRRASSPGSRPGGGRGAPPPSASRPASRSSAPPSSRPARSPTPREKR